MAICILHVFNAAEVGALRSCILILILPPTRSFVYCIRSRIPVHHPPLSSNRFLGNTWVFILACAKACCFQIRAVGEELFLLSVLLNAILKNLHLLE